MDIFTGMLIGGIIGFVCGIVLISGINANGTKEQVHDIENVFFKHIEINFKHIKANHGDSYKDNK